MLQAAWPNWTPAPTLVNVSLQYSARILELRRKGFQISNKTEFRNGQKCGYFRLGSPPLPSNRERRAAAKPDLVERPSSLFADLTSEPEYPD